MLDGFLSMQSKNLRLPGSDGSTAGLLRHWTTYSKLNNEYLMTKRERLNQLFAGSMKLNEGLVWDGDGDNPNAALTVFRNFDNAAVVQGLVGAIPKTAWIIDYPMLERIHYLLTVDFDVFGNVGHQLNTRLYMDFLRIEGEYNLLLLLPEAKRLEIRDHWYRGTSRRVRRYLRSCEAYLHEDPTIEYVTEDPKAELLQRLKARVSPALNQEFELDADEVPRSHANSLKILQGIQGLPANFLSESTNLRVVRKDGTGRLYTLFANRAHSNITSLFFEESNRLPNEDTITVANGVVGDYPNAFMQVDEKELDTFVSRIQNLKSKQDYVELMSDFGVRRTNPDFWQHSDAVHADFQSQQPELASWLDYSRLENR